MGSEAMTEQESAQRITPPIVKWGIPLVTFFAAWLSGSSLTNDQRSIGAVFALTVALWITEALPLAVTALLSTTMLVLIAGIDEKIAFGAYGDPIISLFIGSFLLAKAMEVTGLDQRLVWWILKQPWASGSAGRLLFATGIVSCVISLFVSNTATTAMLLPVVAGIIIAMNASGTRFATGMMLMLTWGSSVAVGVPVGTPPNLIAMGLIEKATGHRIGFLEWMAFGLPITALMVIGAWIALRLHDLRKPPSTKAAYNLAVRQYAGLPPMSTGERNTLIAFFTALVLWIAPDLIAAIFQVTTGSSPDMVGWLQKRVTATVASLIGASLLFLLPAGGDSGGRTLTWKQALGIDWGIVLLFGGGIALGQAMFSSGLAKTMGDSLASISGANSLWAITALCIILAILLSELASNTAAATAIVPVAIGLAQGAGVSPIAPALGAAIGASFGFMLPVSTPPNAIIYSSGHVTSGQMARRGFLIDLLGFAVTLLCLRLILPLLGLV